MSMIISGDTLALTTSPGLSIYRSNLRTSFASEHYTIADRHVQQADVLADIKRAAESAGDTSTVKAIDALGAAKNGEFTRAIPNFKAAFGVLREYLKRDMLDGWIYVQQKDGSILPELICDISHEEENKRTGARASVTIHTLYFSPKNDERQRQNIVRRGIQLTPQDVSRKRVGDALEAQGVFKETSELRVGYDKTMARYIDLIKGGFQQEFRVNGGEEDGRRMVHDLSEADYGTRPGSSDAAFLEDHPTLDGVGLVPEHPWFAYSISVATRTTGYTPTGWHPTSTTKAWARNSCSRPVTAICWTS